MKQRGWGIKFQLCILFYPQLNASSELRITLNTLDTLQAVWSYKDMLPLSKTQEHTDIMSQLSFHVESLSFIRTLHRRRTLSGEGFRLCENSGG